jgi:hypothetical protein
MTDLYSEKDFNFQMDITESPVIFAEEILKITMNDFQQNTIKELKNNDVEKQIARQSGKTLLGEVLILHKCLFENNSICFVKSANFATSTEILNNITRLYDRIPVDVLEKYMTKISEKTKTRVSFENGSHIRIYDKEETTRGIDADFIYIDEGEISEAISIMQKFARKLALRT